MSIRRAGRKLGMFAAATTLAATIAGLSFEGASFATGPAAGSEVPGSAIPIGASTPGPLLERTGLEVKIPANSTLSPGAGIFMLECAAPGGVAPTDPSDCDGLTVQPDTCWPMPTGRSTTP